MADDDDDDLMFFKEALNSIIDKTNIICALDGVELLKILKDNIPPPPDYVFLDLNMPRKTGYECLKEIRTNVYYKDLRVVILTTSRRQSDIEMTYQEGADYYICKPNTLIGYQEALKKLFNFKFRNKPSKEQFVVN